MSIRIGTSPPSRRRRQTSTPSSFGRPRSSTTASGLEHRRLLERGLAVAREPHLVSVLGQRAADHVGDVDVVLHHEHPGGLLHRPDGREGRPFRRRRNEVSHGCQAQEQAGRSPAPFQCGLEPSEARAAPSRPDRPRRWSRSPRSWRSCSTWARPAEGWGRRTEDGLRFLLGGAAYLGAARAVRGGRADRAAPAHPRGRAVPRRRDLPAAGDHARAGRRIAGPRPRRLRARAAARPRLRERARGSAGRAALRGLAQPRSRTSARTSSSSSS